MIHVIAASCNTGSWQQKWNCGWHQPVNSTATHIGYAAGHNLAPIVIGLLILWVILKAARRRGRATAGKVSQGRG